MGGRTAPVRGQIGRGPGYDEDHQRVEDKLREMWESPAVQNSRELHGTAVAT